MSYTIRRVSVGSAIRLGVTLGWIVALGPALGLAGLAVMLLQRLNQALLQVTPFSFSFLGQELARLDILELLKLQSAAQVVGQAATHAPETFLGLAALLALAGTIGFIALTLFLVLAYNLIGRLGWGLSVDLRSDLGD